MSISEEDLRHLRRCVDLELEPELRALHQRAATRAR